MEWDTAISLLALYSYWPSPLLKFLPIFPTPLLQVSYASLLASLSLTRIHGDRKHHFSKFKKKKKSRKLRKKTEFQEVMKQGMLHIHNAVTAFSALQWWNYLGQKKKPKWMNDKTDFQRGLWQKHGHSFQHCCQTCCICTQALKILSFLEVPLVEAQNLNLPSYLTRYTTVSF